MQQSPWGQPGPPQEPIPPYVPAQPQMPGPGDPEGVSVLRAIKAVFESPNWKTNILLGIVFMIIPFVGPIVLNGWMCESHQRWVRRHPDPFPKMDFSDFVEYLKRGLAPFVVGLVVAIPLVFISYAFVGGGVIGVVALGAATNEPLIIAAAGVGVGLLSLLVLMMFTVPINAAQTRAELTEDIGQALSFGKIMSYSKATFGRVLVKNFIFFFVAFGITLLGMLACYLGLYPAIVLIQIASMHLRYQIYVDYLARGGEPIALKAPQQLPSEVRMQQQQQYAIQPGYIPPPGRY